MADFDDPVTKCKACCCCGCCVGWLVTFIVLIATSLRTLDQGQFGMKFLHWSQTITGEPMTEPGVKSVGPLNNLVRYPSVFQMVYFDDFENYEQQEHEVVKPLVHSRTYDGLQVYVRVSFQWKLEAQHIKSIYEILGGAEDLLFDRRTEDKPSFVESLVRFARGALTQVCSQYTASQFFGNQTLVEAKMRETLQATFNQPEKGLVISIQGLQLRSVDLPSKYEAAIAETQKQEQDYQTAMAERATNRMKLDSELMQAEKKQEELLVDAQGNVRAIMEENRAWVEQYTNFQKKQAQSYAAVLRALNSSSDPYGALFELMRQKALKAHNPDKVTLSM
uniref:Band 7 domain-containing protein n=1 Tax=Pyrodinium bahamense TaxID=73915 RepID=A0A7S0FNN4_9DINO